MADVQILTMKFYRNLDHEIFKFCSTYGIYISDYRGKALGVSMKYKLMFIVIDGSIKAYLTTQDRHYIDFIEGRQYRIKSEHTMPGTSSAFNDFPAKLSLLGIYVRWHHGKNGITRATSSPE